MAHDAPDVDKHEKLKRVAQDLSEARALNKQLRVTEEGMEQNDAARHLRFDIGARGCRS